MMRSAMRIEVVWGVLVLATCMSLWLGADGGSSVRAGTVVVLAICFAKIRLVGIHFMELGGAPAAVRALFEAYVGVVAIALATLYFLS
jgi:Prokaryotic Cytochrome C oxidase subunit IV